MNCINLSNGIEFLFKLFILFMHSSSVDICLYILAIVCHEAMNMGVLRKISINLSIYHVILCSLKKVENPAILQNINEPGG